MLVEHLHQQAEGAATISLSRTLDEVLPNVLYQPPDADAFRVNELIVIGDIVDVEDGVAQHWSGERPGTRTEFDDPTADSRTFHLVIGNIEVLAGEAPRDPVRVGVSVGGFDDPAVLREGFKSLGHVIVFLGDGGPVFAYDDSLYSTTTGVILTVGDDGRIEAPLMEPVGVTEFMGDIHTLDDLRRALAQPERVIELTGSSGAYQRPPDS